MVRCRGRDCVAGMMTNSFIRDIELLIGPLPEWEGGGDESKGVRIISDGSRSTLRVRFTVLKQYGAAPMPSTFTITNLSPKLRNVLQTTPNVQVSLRVGWMNTDRMLIFTGTVITVVSQRSGPDIETTLAAFASFTSMERSVFTKTFSDEYPLSEAVYSVAKVFEEEAGVIVSKNNISVDSNVVFGYCGWSFAGSVSDAMDQLARVYGFSWRIENNTFYAQDDRNYVGGKVHIGTKNGFLLRAEPLLVTAPGQTIYGQSDPGLMKGVMIQSVLNPLIEAGGIVVLDSSINPGINGEYKVATVTQSGDSHGSTWYSDVMSFNYDFAGNVPY